jgi:hypothetical protein
MVLYVKNYVHFLSYLARFLLEREKFQVNIAEKIKTYILSSITFSKIILFVR